MNEIHQQKPEPDLVPEHEDHSTIPTDLESLSITNQVRSGTPFEQLSTLEDITNIPIQNPKLRSELLRIVDLGETHLLPATLENLVNTPDADVLDAFSTALQKANSEVVCSVAKAITHIDISKLDEDNQEKITDTLAAVLDSHDIAIRESVAQALGHFEIRGILKLVESFQDSTWLWGHKEVFKALDAATEKFFGSLKLRRDHYRDHEDSKKYNSYLIDSVSSIYTVTESLKKSISYIKAHGSSSVRGKVSSFYYTIQLNKLLQEWIRPLIVIVHVSHVSQEPWQKAEQALVALGTSALPLINKYIKHYGIPYGMRDIPEFNKHGPRDIRFDLWRVLDIVEKIGAAGHSLNYVKDTVKKLVKKELGKEAGTPKAVKLLGYLGKTGLKFLRLASENEKEKVQALAAQGLAIYNQPEANPIVLKLLKDPSATVRLAAATAYINTDMIERHPDQLNQVIRVIKESLYSIRDLEKLELYKLGTAVVPLLDHIVYSKNDRHRYSYIRAIAKCVEADVDQAIPLALFVLVSSPIEVSYGKLEQTPIFQALANSKYKDSLPLLLTALSNKLKDQPSSKDLKSSDYYDSLAEKTMLYLSNPGDYCPSREKLEALIEELLAVHSE